MRLALVVEGQGEVAALPVVIRRLAVEHDWPLTVAAKPWREPRHRMVLPEHLARVLQMLRGRSDAALLVLDGDDDCAVELASQLRQLAHQLAPGYQVSVVVAVREFEAWLVAAAESLRSQRGMPADLARPPFPEGIRDAKGWLDQHLPSRYSPTIDQPALAAVFDLAEAERWSRSFRKLIKELSALATR